MRVGAINNTNFKQVVEPHRKEDNNGKETKNSYETTIIYKETVKVPKEDEDTEETLQQLNYMV